MESFKHDIHWRDSGDGIVIGSLVERYGGELRKVHRLLIKPEDVENVGVVVDIQRHTTWDGKFNLALVQWLRLLPVGTLYVFHEESQTGKLSGV